MAAQVPDTVNAIICARRGYCSLALSGTLSSQVVGVCIGFGLPWLITALSGQPPILETAQGDVSGLEQQLYAQLIVCAFCPLAWAAPAMLTCRTQTRVTSLRALIFMCLCLAAVGICVLGLPLPLRQLRGIM